jgi:hypothetical protein
MKEKKKDKISEETVHVHLVKQSVGRPRTIPAAWDGEGGRRSSLWWRDPKWSNPAHLLDPAKPEMARNMIPPGLTPPTHHQTAGLTLEPSALSPSSILLPVMASS